MGRLIVEAEVRTSFLFELTDTIKILNLNLRHRSILLLKTTLRTKSSRLCARALKDAAGPGIDTVSVQAAATTTLQPVSTHEWREEKKELWGLGLGKFWVMNETSKISGKEQTTDK